MGSQVQKFFFPATLHFGTARGFWGVSDLPAHAMTLGTTLRIFIQLYVAASVA